MKKKYSDFKWRDKEVYANFDKHIFKKGYQLNIVIGARSLRKSSNARNNVIKEALENLDWDTGFCNKRFVWMRYTWGDIDKVKVNFFGNFIKYLTEPQNKILNNLMDGLVIGVVGYQMWVSKDIKDLGKTGKSINIGEFLAVYR